MAGAVSTALESSVADGSLEADGAQLMLAARLDGLIAALGRRRKTRGLYVWGAAGRGKTLLMDMFFRAAPGSKRRAHFHAFMADVHDRLPDYRGARQQPVVALARALAAEARLLCLDEMQVRDIADATILSRLFATLIGEGTVIVTTSNMPPGRLYDGGLNRELFLPFIRLVEERLDVVPLESARDFRLNKLMAAPVWHVPPDAAAMDAAFLRLTGSPLGAPEALHIKGREIAVPNARGGVARFSFSGLCDAPLGAVDYRAIACHYHTVLIDGVPRLDTLGNDAVRRFVLLIDEFYEHRVKLVASAEAMPEALLSEGPQALEFHRTASRLAEMSSRDWLALPHGQTT